MMLDKDYINVAEAASLLQVGSQTIYGIIRRKELPAFKFGRVWRIASDDFKNYVSSAYIAKASASV